MKTLLIIFLIFFSVTSHAQKPWAKGIKIEKDSLYTDPVRDGYIWIGIIPLAKATTLPASESGTSYYRLYSKPPVLTYSMFKQLANRVDSIAANNRVQIVVVKDTSLNARIDSLIAVVSSLPTQLGTGLPDARIPALLASIDSIKQVQKNLDTRITTSVPTLADFNTFRSQMGTLANNTTAAVNTINSRLGIHDVSIKTLQKTDSLRQADYFALNNRVLKLESDTGITYIYGGKVIDPVPVDQLPNYKGTSTTVIDPVTNKVYAKDPTTKTWIEQIDK